MQVFTGQYDRTIDAKNRIQLPSQLRAAIDRERDGPGLYVTLGEFPGTLALFTERGFEELSTRLETEYEQGEASRRFELQFYALASYVEMDKQGRVVLPERLVRKAKLGEEVFIVGQKHRIEIWKRADLEQAMEIDWAGDDWPDWPAFIRRRPAHRRET